MRGTAFSMRMVGLVATGSVMVHELRYLVAGGGPSEDPGHAYLPLVGLASALLLGVAAAQFAGRMERARRTGRREGECLGFRAAWLVIAASLIAVFLAQELLEGALAGERAGGVAGALGGGGWVALPLSVALGAPLALALRGARAALSLAAREARRAMPRLLAPVRRPPRAPQLGQVGVLARHLAGRAPPVAP